MQLVKSTADLRLALDPFPRVTLVPTMGNLHEGHLSLVRIAHERGAPVITSIFVNPLQFAPHEDFSTYPRTLDRDCTMLAGAGCDVVFAPTEAEIYPDNEVIAAKPPPELAHILEGAVRPGFFAGVCTVALRLFNIVRPAAAVFGKKDYQQLLVVRRMLQQLGLPIEIISGNIVRDATGVALSSRNAYLREHERSQAIHLKQALDRVAAAVRAGDRNWRSLESTGAASLITRGWQVDYVAIRRQTDLGEPTPSNPLLVLGAARLGNTRLIDNVEIELAAASRPRPHWYESPRVCFFPLSHPVATLFRPHTLSLRYAIAIRFAGETRHKRSTGKGMQT
jgi:pantoate--beta-alanine ligase